MSRCCIDSGHLSRRLERLRYRTRLQGHWAVSGKAVLVTHARSAGFQITGYTVTIGSRLSMALSPITSSLSLARSKGDGLDRVAPSVARHEALESCRHCSFSRFCGQLSRRVWRQGALGISHSHFLGQRCHRRLGGQQCALSINTVDKQVTRC